MINQDCNNSWLQNVYFCISNQANMNWLFGWMFSRTSSNALNTEDPTNETLEKMEESLESVHKRQKKIREMIAKEIQKATEFSRKKDRNCKALYQMLLTM
jgi:hypothetical protein